MSSLNDVAPYALAAGGFALLAGTVWTPVALPQPVTWTGLLAGSLTALAGGFWIDHRQSPIDSTTELAVRVLSLVGLLVLFGAIGNYGFGNSTRFALAGVGIGIYAVVGYWTYFRRLPGEADERQRTIRYRAVYNGFVTLCGLLFAVTILAFALGTPTSEHAGGPTLLGLGAFGLVLVGAMVVLVSEGWYRTRM